jgi:Ca-activated chloride channel family protein
MKTFGSLVGKVTVAEFSRPLENVKVEIVGLKLFTYTDKDGKFKFEKVPSGKFTVKFSKDEYKEELITQVEITKQETTTLNCQLSVDRKTKIIHAKSKVEQFSPISTNNQVQDDLYELETVSLGACVDVCELSVGKTSAGESAPLGANMFPSINKRSNLNSYSYIPTNESYDKPTENGYKYTQEDPLSTFSIDVDAASYSNMRRFINLNSLPPADAVRPEEMINYFTYNYPQPRGNKPFSITTEVAECPWNKDHLLAHIGLQGKTLDLDEAPKTNFVFLIDTSGSMSSPDKLPLLQSSMRLLTEQLRKDDRVAIVTYAGSAGLTLESTSGKDKSKILSAINNMRSGGSTAGGAGIKLAYKVAQENFIKGGNNRIILATDGDFNVGQSSDSDMDNLITSKRDAGVFLTVLGFGTGNYKDSKMEILADKGNGNYAYIDNILEAKKVLVNEFGGTFFTIAKDVKIQIEFNPENVAAYRLIGYENRILAAKDFNDDKKDAGELGAGHTVTAIYEIVTPDKIGSLGSVDDLKYQKTKPKKKQATQYSDELMTVKFRYKKPDGDKSKKIVSVVTVNDIVRKTSDNFRFSASVAAFGQLLANTEYVDNYSFGSIVKLAKSAYGKDDNGYRHEFVKLVEKAELINQ